MNIALVGYGNMGRMIASLCEAEPENQIVSISYKKGERVLDKKCIKKSDVTIDFTSPDIVLETVKEILPLHVPLVIGTTGWLDSLPQVEKLVEKYDGALLYGGNFSIGANIFFKIVGYASSYFNMFNEYDVYGLETHHAMKKDSPSGTAKELASIIMQNISRKRVLTTDRLDRKIRPEELHFQSIRGGVTSGEHQIVFDSMYDKVVLKHTAHSRLGFAKGALLAAKFLQGKKGIYRFDQVFDEVIQL